MMQAARIRQHIRRCGVVTLVAIVRRSVSIVDHAAMEMALGLRYIARLSVRPSLPKTQSIQVIDRTRSLEINVCYLLSDNDN